MTTRKKKVVRPEPGLKMRKLMWLSLTTLWCLSASPILKSSWAGDDWPNSQTPYWLAWRYGSASFGNTIHEALYWNRAWMLGQGRFYPVHWLESRIEFVYLREIWQYKIYQYSILIIAGLLFCYLIKLLAGSDLLAAVTLTILCVTVQIRRGFDPHLAFAGMVPSMLIKVFIACIFIFLASVEEEKKKIRLYSAISALFYFLALSTYEFSFFLLPAVLMCYQIGHDKRKGQNRKQNLNAWANEISLRIFDRTFRPVLLAWLGYGFLVFGVLRRIAKDVSGSYVLGISWESIPVFISQIFTGIPIISVMFGAELLNWFKANYLFIALAFILSTIIVFLFLRSLKGNRYLGSNDELLDKKFFQSITIFATFLVLAPGFMMSLQQSWWGRASIQNSYLGVLITEFGSALLIAACFVNYRLFTRKVSRLFPKAKVRTNEN